MADTPRPERVVVGKVTKAHGIRGELRVQIISDLPERFAGLSEVWLSRREGTELGSYNVERVRRLGKDVGLVLAGVADRGEAEQLKGAFVEARRLPDEEMPDGEYYVFDLAGMEVRDENGSLLGLVHDVERYPANDVLVVDGAERRYQFPMVGEIIRNIDHDSRVIVVNVIEGLLDL